MLLTNKTILLKIFFAIIFTASVEFSFAQCFQIESVLIDACGPTEWDNEMVRFKVGSTNLNVSNLNVTWPNPTNSFLGIVQNASTAAKVIALNNSIIGCGLLKEPSAGILPAGSTVILISGITNFDVAANSFANLNDTIYLIFQNSGNTAGHFVNYGTTGGLTKTLSMSFSSPGGCSDVVTYNKSLLVTQAGIAGTEDGATVEYTPSGVATYTNYGCVAPIVIKTLNINQSGFTICPGDTINLSATVVGSFSSTTWVGGHGTFSSANNLTTNYYSNATDNANFYIYINGQTTCGTPVKDSVLVQIGGNTSSVNITSPSTVLCIGDSILLTASGTGNYIWNIGSTANSIYVSTAGTYSVTSTSTCGSSSDNIVITLVPPTTVTITEPDTTLCQAQSITLHANGGSSYLWNTGATTNTLTISLAGNYSVTSTAGGCPSNTDSVQVTVTPQITVSILEPDINNICTGQSITLHAIGSGPFLWNTGSTTNSIIVSTTGSFFVTSANSCFSVSDTVQVNIIPSTTVAITEPNVNVICMGQNITLHASGATSYIWNTGANTDSIVVNTAGIYSVSANTTCPSNTDSVQVSVTPQITVSILEPDINPLCFGQSITLHAIGSGPFLWNTGATTSSIIASTTGSFLVTSTNSCFGVSDTVQVNIIPPTTVTILEPDIAICQGQSITLHANGATSYLWNTGATTNSLTVSLAGNYSVTTNGGCPSNTDTTHVTIIPQITVSIAEGTSATLCTGTPLTLNAIGGTNFIWSTGELTNSISINSIGVYIVETTNGSCPSGFDTITIVNDAPPTALIVGDSIFCSEKSLTLVASGTGSFFWSTGEVGNSTTITFTQQVILTSVDNCGNTAADTLIIEEKDCRTTVFIPNTFTPNNDGDNDLFIIKGFNIESFKGKIYNRWGELLFEWEDLNGGWDGCYKKHLVQEDTYVYQIKVKFIDNIFENYTGGFLLMK